MYYYYYEENNETEEETEQTGTDQHGEPEPEEESINSRERLITGGEYAGDSGLISFEDFDVFSVGAAAFAGCVNLESAGFGPNLIRIGSHAFRGCKNLKDVWFPMLDRKARVRIAENAFEGCGKICFHVFGLGLKNAGNDDIEEYAMEHGFELVGMM